MKTKGFGIRGMFRSAIVVVFVTVYVAFASISLRNVTSDELERADASIRSEVNYLCLQLESLGERADAFSRIGGVAGVAKEELEAADPEGYRLLSDPVGDVLSGYTLAETGTVAIIADGAVVTSDDARVPAGSDVRGLLGDTVCDAIDASIESGQIQTIPYRGVFDEAGGAYGDDDDEAYLLAGRQNGYTIMVIEPMSMVFRDRAAVMGRELFAGLVVLIVVGAIVDRLLSCLVARRIDKTNEALERITSGDLDTRVEEGVTREFKSLASGINVTVEALQGWIAEAESRMDSELAAARAIQESALPCTFPPYPDISAFDVYAVMDAAKEVGGDFYDFFLIGDAGPGSGKLAFLIADVSGKGVPAALFMMKAKALVRSELESGEELGRAVESVSATLADGNSACMFVTLWVGVLDYGTGRVTYVNAGHNPPVFWQEGVGLRWLKERSGLPLGLPRSRSYNAYSIDCHDGDKFLLFTDGVTEAASVDKALYGTERLGAVVTASARECPEALVHAVHDDVVSFAQDAEQSDDITLLALEVRTSPLSFDSACNIY